MILQASLCPRLPPPPPGAGPHPQPRATLQGVASRDRGLGGRRVQAATRAGPALTQTCRGLASERLMWPQRLWLGCLPRPLVRGWCRAPVSRHQVSWATQSLLPGQERSPAPSEAPHPRPATPASRPSLTWRYPPATAPPPVKEVLGHVGAGPLVEQRGWRPGSPAQRASRHSAASPSSAQGLQQASWPLWACPAPP